MCIQKLIMDDTGGGLNALSVIVDLLLSIIYEGNINVENVLIYTTEAKSIVKHLKQKCIKWNKLT